MANTNLNLISWTLVLVAIFTIFNLTSVLIDTSLQNKLQSDLGYTWTNSKIQIYDNDLKSLQSEQGTLQTNTLENDIARTNVNDVAFAEGQLNIWDYISLIGGVVGVALSAGYQVLLSMNSFAQNTILNILLVLVVLPIQLFTTFLILKLLFGEGRVGG